MWLLVLSGPSKWEIQFARNPEYVQPLVALIINYRAPNWCSRIKVTGIYGRVFGKFASFLGMSYFVSVFIIRKPRTTNGPIIVVAFCVVLSVSLLQKPLLQRRRLGSLLLVALRWCFLPSYNETTAPSSLPIY